MKILKCEICGKTLVEEDELARADERGDKPSHFCNKCNQEAARRFLRAIMGKKELS